MRWIKLYTIVALAFFLETSNIIPQAYGDSLLYLPFIAKSPICDPAFVQIGGPGDDTLTLLGSTSLDQLCMYGLEGNDTIIYEMGPGDDAVFIDGGPGNDTLTIKANGQSFTIISGGQIIYQWGVGGTTVTVVNVEQITVIGDNGETIWQKNAPVAKAGPDQTVNVGAAVTLNGSGSFDADNDPLTYHWYFSSLPIGSNAVLTNGDKVKPFFLADKAGTYVIQLLVNDGSFTSNPDEVRVTAMEGGVLLSGDPTTPAVNAIYNLPAVAVDESQIEDDIIMTRLDVYLALDATVGQVNDALVQVNGGIVTMRMGLHTVTIAIPRPPDLTALRGIAKKLNGLPGIESVAIAVTVGPQELPFVSPDADDLTGLKHLLPTRFPAAWNAKSLAFNNCLSNKVRVLVPDNFLEPIPSSYMYFPIEIPYSDILPPGESGNKTHGYDVTTTMAALFDDDNPTGANPFSQCLDISLIRVTGLTNFQETDRIAGNFPPGKFIMNFSQGYVDKNACSDPCIPNCGRTIRPCTPNDADRVRRPFFRAYEAMDWKHITRQRWQDFLAATAAGNDRNKEIAGIYPGTGRALYNNQMTYATSPDPFFGDITDALIWGPTPAYNQYATHYDSLTASQLEAGILQNRVRLWGSIRWEQPTTY